MARKVLPATPARDRSRDDESLLLRSAETLGRMIGSLQRQLDVATGRLAGTQADVAAVRKSGVAKRSGSKAKSGTAARGGARKKSASSTKGKTSRRRATKSVKKR